MYFVIYWSPRGYTPEHLCKPLKLWGPSSSPEGLTRDHRDLSVALHLINMYIFCIFQGWTDENPGISVRMRGSTRSVFSLTSFLILASPMTCPPLTWNKPPETFYHLSGKMALNGCYTRKVPTISSVDRRRPLQHATCWIGMQSRQVPSLDCAPISTSLLPTTLFLPVVSARRRSLTLDGRRSKCTAA